MHSFNRRGTAAPASPLESATEGQYPDERAYCYTELTVSSLAMAVITASTYFTYPERGDWTDNSARNLTIRYIDIETICRYFKHFMY